MRNRISLLILTLFTLPALADHDATHLCDYTSPGYIVNRYQNNGDGTVLDRYTNLTWQRCSLGNTWSDEASGCSTGYLQRRNWKETLELVALFNQQEAAAGRVSDWRLPNIKELSTIVNLNCAYPAIDVEVFPNTETAYWSSTPSVSALELNRSGYYEHAVWYINFQTGREHIQTINEISAARLVRGAD